MTKLVSLSNNKIIKSILNGKIIIVGPKDVSSFVPLFCPLCDFPMKTLDDSISFRKNKLCNHCDEKWTNNKNITWPKGPDKKTQEWKEYIDYRNIISKPSINFK